MHEFKFSEDFIRRRKRLLAVVLPFVVLGLFVFGLSICNWRIADVLVPFGITAAILGVVLLVEAHLAFRSMRKQRVCITEMEITKVSGTINESISWERVSRVHITEDKPGETIGIVVYPAQGRSVHIAGFEHMDRIAEMVAEAVPVNTSRDVKKLRYRPDSPLISVTSIAVTLAFLILAASFGQRVFIVASCLPAAAAGVAILAFRPLTKSNAKLALPEIIMSSLMIIGCLLLVLSATFRWGF
jgi:hypothetical protein